MTQTTLLGQAVRTGIHNKVIINRTGGKSLPSSIKSNIPGRVVFRLSSAGELIAVDILGAENLQQGKIVHKPNLEGLVRLKARFTPEGIVKKLVKAVKQASTHD